MPVESVYPALEPLLPRVRKPIQYVGGEVGSVTKDWDATDVRWALLYPDAYEVGLPNQGIQILYEVLNEREGVLAERTYTVWPDLEELMRRHGVPQFTVGPREGEVLIRYTHAGLCHSDVHIAHGDLPARLPMVLGHEGAGIIEEVGPGVTRVAPGDHVVCSFIPNCGVCRYCATGRQSICDMGATI